MTGRFAAPELLQLGRPPALAAKDFETLYSDSLTDLIARYNGAGITFDLQKFEVDPSSILLESGAYRDLLRRQAIDDAVMQTYLGSATGAMLDQRSADYGVVRRSIAYSGSISGTAEPQRSNDIPLLWNWDRATSSWREDDESLRTRARLAWEALSVAGPRGAYVFHAAEAHPMVKADATAVYGPETGLVEPGDVLVIAQANNATGVPSNGVIDSVAARLDAHEVVYSNGAAITRQVRDEQTIRPLGARVIVKAVQPVPFHVDAKLYIRAGSDAEIIRLTATQRLNAYLETRRRTALEVPRSAQIAALHVADADGLPVVEEVELISPTEDVAPAYDELAVPTAVLVEVVVR